MLLTGRKRTPAFERPRHFEARFPPDRVAYAVGDIHGCDQSLVTLLDQIREDYISIAVFYDRLPTLVFLGDYIDKGPDSKAVLDRLIRPIDGFERIVFLKGNHEASIIEFIDGVSDGAMWLQHGGLDTLASYGIRPPLLGDTADVERARLALREEFPRDHSEFLRALKLGYQLGNYLFVHAGIDPAKSVADQDRRDMLWIRDEFLSDPGPFEVRVVHGHTPVEIPEVLPHRINLDTGGFVSGVLSCARITSDDVTILQSV